MDTHLGAHLPAATSPATAAAALQQQRSELDDAAAVETLAALQEYRAELLQHNVLGIAAVATAAVRQARNAGQIAAAAADIIGCPLQVLSGEGLLHRCTWSAVTVQHRAAGSITYCLYGRR
jgi:hypothetical protein